MGSKFWERLTYDEGLFKVTLCHHFYLLCVCYHLHVSRNAGPGYHFASNGQKDNHLLFLDDLKLYTSNEKSLESLIETIRVFSNDIGMKFRVGKFAVLSMKKGKMAYRIKQQ